MNGTRPSARKRAEDKSIKDSDHKKKAIADAVWFWFLYLGFGVMMAFMLWFLNGGEQ